MMALQFSKDTRFGITCPEAYAKITELRFSMVTRTASILVSVWANGQARRLGKEPIEIQTLTITDKQYDTYFSPSADSNIYRLAYTSLKSIFDEFLDSLDV